MGHLCSTENDLNKSYTLLKILYHTQFRDTALCGLSVLYNSEIQAVVMSIWSFMKIHQLIKKPLSLSHIHMHTHTHTHTHTWVDNFLAQKEREEEFYNLVHGICFIVQVIHYSEIFRFISFHINFAKTFFNIFP
jgi:hypothetical protein